MRAGVPPLTHLPLFPAQTANHHPVVVTSFSARSFYPPPLCLPFQSLRHPSPSFPSHPFSSPVALMPSAFLLYIGWLARANCATFSGASNSCDKCRRGKKVASAFTAKESEMVLRTLTGCNITARACGIIYRVLSLI